MTQLELGDVDAKMFVPARTPLLASMGRWVILSNEEKGIKNPVKIVNEEDTDRDVYRQTTSSKARNQHASPRNPCYVLVGDEERVMMEDDDDAGG